MKFTDEMKKTHTMLIPMMLPIHFELITETVKSDGFKAILLRTTHREIAEEGLKSVHNDTCYPALLVIGQLLDALKSGEHNLEETAVFITQTGGGCRASNYMSLLKKALVKNGFDTTPIAMFNVGNPAAPGVINFSKRAIFYIILSLLYGDMLMRLQNQCIPYEKQQGATKKMVDKWLATLTNQIHGKGDRKFTSTKANFKAMLKDFATIERDTTKPKLKVGIVGEIYIKYSPLGNNHLEEYLAKNNAEVINSGMMEFGMYRFYSMLHECKLFGSTFKRKIIYKLVMAFFLGKHRQLINAIKSQGIFTPPADFTQVVKMCKGYLDHGVKMGEGWLLTAEMLELIHSGVNNIVAVQPFGCLPNHIVAKGMARKIKDNHPGANIVTLDYDPGASKINQENRLRLMLANAL